MSVRGRQLILFCLFFLLVLPDVWAFFGLTAREPLATLSWEVQDNVLGMEKLQRQHNYRGSDKPGKGPTTSGGGVGRGGAGGSGGGGGGGGGGVGGGGRGGRRRLRLPSNRGQQCELLNLHRRQARMCRRGKGIPQTLIKATRISVVECQHQFKYERWNCSLGQYRQKILQKGTKETSFLYAVSSAGLVHEFARACSQGILDRCTCDESNPAESKKTWMWGGCGDNIKFGVQFTRRFLKKAHKSGKDIRAKVDQHNSRVGIKVVKNQVNTTCKCHGVSGSCTVKTCWLQLAPFHSVGNILKRKYEQSEQAFSHTNKATGKTRLLSKKRKGGEHRGGGGGAPVVGRGRGRGGGGGNRLLDSNMTVLRRGELAYIEESPSFCERSRYSPGTQGRVCSKDSSCESICCGRGYNVQYRRVKKACHCEVIWCCEVKCKECLVSEEIYTCK